VKLAVSNLAWNTDDEPSVLDLLARHAVDGIEVAPTKWWPNWVGAGAEAAADERARLASRGFVAPAVQAVLFERPELQVFGSREVQDATIAHLARVAELAAGLGSNGMVFGSPKNRARGTIEHSEAMAIAEDFFRRVGDVCQPWNVGCYIEPNPAVYQCDFLTHWQEVREIVRRVSHPHVGIHLDTACIVLAGDDPAEAIKACAGDIRHFHVSEPQLAGFSDSGLDHPAFGAALADSGYEGWISIEMRASTDPLRGIDEAVRRVQAWYL
jgi:D-psicose/D-tagatose/L-ribulose 3-epimerase